MEVLLKAANILDTSEFEVLRRAYVNWHGSEAPGGLLQATFSLYLKTQELPHWAKHYALQVVQAFEAELQKEGQLLRLFFLLFAGGLLRIRSDRSFLA